MPSCIKIGDLVHVYAVDATGIHGPHHVGLYMGWDSSDVGWIVMTEGKVEVYALNFWACRKVGESR